MAGTAGERRPTTVQELVSPGGDGGLRDTLAAGGLLHRHLAAKHRQHDAQLVLHGLDGWSAQQDSFSSRPRAKFELSHRILTQHTFDSDATRQAAQQAGAATFVPKHAPPEQVPAAVVAAFRTRRISPIPPTAPLLLPRPATRQLTNLLTLAHRQ